jgi:hypothetical protein
VQRDQRIEDRGVDLVVADCLRDAFNQAGVDGEVAVSLGDAQRHFVAGGHEPPAAKFFHGNVEMLADGGEAAVELVDVVLAVVKPHPQPFRGLLAQQVACCGHGDTLDHAQRCLSDTAGRNRAAYGAALVMSPIKPFPRGKGCGIERDERAQHKRGRSLFDAGLLAC